MTEPTTPPTPPALAEMRPTLVVGAGGTGQQIVTFLKAVLEERFGSAWRQKIRLLAFDTAEEAFTAQASSGEEIRLEPSAELLNIGNVPVPSIMRNIDGLEAIRERLGNVIPSLPPVVLRSGAKQLRPFGLLSLLWNYRVVSEELGRAIWVLAGRDRADNTNQGQGINIFICGSLVGGTGSGVFLDLAHLIRALFNELGSQAEFCHITGIGVLPQAFHGIKGPNLYPNTAAALQELNHLMVKTGFHARYPDGRTIESREAPFNLFYVMDGVDERGQTWSGVTPLCEMIAEGIYLQMGSQLGRKGENAFDNLDEILTGQVANGEGTFLSSFGLGYLEFDAPAVADLCARYFLLELIQQGWLAAPAASGAAKQVGAPVVPSGQQLLPRLLYDASTGGEIRTDLPLPGWLLQKRPEEVTAEAVRYVRAYGQARLAETFFPQVNQNCVLVLREEQQHWAAWATNGLLDPALGLPSVTAALNQARQAAIEWADAARKKLAELARREERQAEAVAQLETALSRAAGSFLVGRANRIRAALTLYFQAAHELYETQLQAHLLQAQGQLWSDLAGQLQSRIEIAQTLQQRLSALAGRLESALPLQTRHLAMGGISRLSLADESYVQLLYQEYKGAWADVKKLVGDPLALGQLSTAELESYCLAVLSGSFEPIRQMTAEKVLRERAGEMTPRARRQQLFRLATPSWNINRARLPEGGAGLVRLEVLGVADQAETLFSDEPMLVSTRDPHRVAALVVVAGAPQSALQQYDRFQEALSRQRGRPFHVLPDFLTVADQARLAFALGSIFGLIYNQGTFFYYRPEDALNSPVQLANGLTNAIQAFIARDGLAGEVTRRVELQIARMGLQEAITVLTGYYSSVPNGATRLDEQSRELKRLVRDYTDDLRRIDDFSAGLKMTR
ncbi:MAG: hypothetical protein L0332_17745 [Chloroflexi bacterium]|nr:hypothetical protein [Chloroflexota bacterium]MCI0728545.1 hypothetical protein [Chloroflexota bacterium]